MPTPNGRFIRRSRVEAGLKPGDLARLADIPPKTIYCIESVSQPVAIERLYRIAHVLKVDVNKLIARPEPEPASTADVA